MSPRPYSPWPWRTKPCSANLGAELLVLACLIGHHAGLASDVLAQDRHQRLGAQVVNDHRTLLARVTLDERKNLVLVMEATARLDALRLGGAVVADERLVNFDKAAVAAHRGKRTVAH